MCMEGVTEKSMEFCVVTDTVKIVVVSSLTQSNKSGSLVVEPDFLFEIYTRVVIINIIYF